MICKDSFPSVIFGLGRYNSPSIVFWLFWLLDGLDLFLDGSLLSLLNLNISFCFVGLFCLLVLILILLIIMRLVEGSGIIVWWLFRVGLLCAIFIFLRVGLVGVITTILLLVIRFRNVLEMFLGLLWNLFL